MTMITRGRLLGVLLGLVLLLVPGVALAHEEPIDDNGLMVRVDGNVHVAPEDRIKTALVIDGDAHIEGRVTGSVFVVHGRAIVDGVVEGDITVIDGVLGLSPTARIGNAMLTNSRLLRSDGSVVTGSISHYTGYSYASLGWLKGLVSFLIWISTTLFLLVAGLAFAAVGGPPLATAAWMLTARPRASALGAILLWSALPTLALFALVTVIGIPVGLVLVAALPVIWVAGYVVAGTRLGAVLLFLLGKTTAGHRYRSAVVGLLALQVVGMLPIIGGPVVALAGLIGSGALAVLLWSARGHRLARPAHGASTGSTTAAPAG